MNDSITVFDGATFCDDEYYEVYQGYEYYASLYLFFVARNHGCMW